MDAEQAMTNRLAAQENEASARLSKSHHSSFRKEAGTQECLEQTLLVQTQRQRELNVCIGTATDQAKLFSISNINIKPQNQK